MQPIVTPLGVTLSNNQLILVQFWSTSAQSIAKGHIVSVSCPLSLYAAPRILNPDRQQNASKSYTPLLYNLSAGIHFFTVLDLSKQHL